MSQTNKEQPMSTHFNIVNTGGEFLKKEFHQLRLGFVANALLAIGTTIAIFSGLLLISDDDLALAGIQLNND
jgi:hypothetical protein